MTAAKAGFGTTLTRAGFTIAELTKIGSPKLSMDTEEVTNHQSADSFKEFIGTLLDAGEVGIEGNFIASDANGQIALTTDMYNKTLQDFVLTFPTAVATTWTFKALVTSFEIGEVDIKGAITFKASLKVSGKPTLGVTAAGNLTGLVVTTGTLIPAFAGTTYDYVATIGTGETSVTITPTCAAATSIEVNGNVVATGQPSSALNLGAAGSITAATVVIKETGKMPKTYAIKLARA